MRLIKHICKGNGCLEPSVNNHELMIIKSKVMKLFQVSCSEVIGPIVVLKTYFYTILLSNVRGKFSKLKSSLNVNSIVIIIAIA